MPRRCRYECDVEAHAQCHDYEKVQPIESLHCVTVGVAVAVALTVYVVATVDAGQLTTRLVRLKVSRLGVTGGGVTGGVTTGGGASAGTDTLLVDVVTVNAAVCCTA